MLNHLVRISTFWLILLLSCRSLALPFFDIFEYRIIGVESLDHSEVQEAISPFTGYARTVKDVDEASRAIQALYQKAGFQTVAISVPDQDINDGVIEIVVQETKIRRISIKGSRYFSLSAIQQAMPSLREGEVLNIRALQKDAQHLNKLSTDLQVVPSVEAAPQPGMVDVELSVSDNLPLHGGIELTNYHSATTTKTRLAADLRYSNLWQRHHQIAIQMQTTPENTDEVSVLALSYLAPSGDDGAKLATYAIASNSDIVTVNDIRVVGDGAMLGSRWVKPIAQSRSAVHSVSLGGDYKNFDEVTYTSGIETAVTPIEYFTLSAQYNLFRRNRNHSDSVSLGFTMGSRKLINKVDEFNEKAFAADSSFSFVKGSWDHTYFLPLGLALKHKLYGQLTEAPLVSNEQFSAGGVGSVRGYYESQITGDYGIGAGLELQSPDLFSSASWVEQFNTHLFIEGAQANKNLPLAGEDQQKQLASIGIGMFAVLFESLSLKADWGVALEPVEGSAQVDGVGDEATITGYVGRIERGDSMLRGSIRYDF